MCEGEMVRHIILWRIKEGLLKEDIARDIKTNLEKLPLTVPGIMKLRVLTENLPSSSCDVMLDSAFESVEALAAYRVHPDHVRVADTYVRPMCDVRLCFDFEDE